VEKLENKVGGVFHFGHFYTFATDKSPFISEKSPLAISGYIIGDLKCKGVKMSIFQKSNKVFFVKFPFFDFAA